MQVFDLFQASMFSIGIFFLFCGMYLLAPKPNKGASEPSVMGVELAELAEDFGYEGSRALG